MRKKKFYFIVFEGIEGTGKSYQIKKRKSTTSLILKSTRQLIVINRNANEGNHHTCSAKRNQIPKHNFDKRLLNELRCEKQRSVVILWFDTAKGKDLVVNARRRFARMLFGVQTHRLWLVLFISALGPRTLRLPSHAQICWPCGPRSSDPLLLEIMRTHAKQTQMRLLLVPSAPLPCNHTLSL